MKKLFLTFSLVMLCNFANADNKKIESSKLPNVETEFIELYNSFFETSELLNVETEFIELNNSFLEESEDCGGVANFYAGLEQIATGGQSDYWEAWFYYFGLCLEKNY